MDMDMTNHNPIKILVEFDENLTSNVVTGMTVSRLLELFKKLKKSERVYLFENIIEDNFDNLIRTEDPVAIKLNTIFKNQKSIINDTASIANELHSTPEGVVNKKRKSLETEEYNDVRRSLRKKLRISEEFIEMEKHKTLNEEELISKFIFKIPDPKFLFLSTISKKVCEKCLEPKSLTNPLIKDTKGWMHEACKENHNPNPNCFICRLPFKDDTKINVLINCSEKGCEELCHQDCSINKDPVKHPKCPKHHCLACSSRNRYYNGPLVNCILCLSSFHKEDICVPAGTQILSQTQIICPRHPPALKNKKALRTHNVDFCHICLDFGSLICCESCPRSFHTKCVKINDNATKYRCEDCVKGKMPMYGDIVWSHVPGYRWWPAIILPNIVVPEIILGSQRHKRDFCLRFFGSYDYYWFPSENVLPYDTYTQLTGNYRFNIKFENAITEANNTRELKKKLEVPPDNVWKKTNINRVVSPVALKKSKIEDIPVCKCSIKDENPCGKNSACINRDLFYECNKLLCPAADKCQNQAMQKRNYANLSTVKTLNRGTGVETVDPLERGDFIIEYLGEVINATEFQQRFTQKVANVDKNFYFMSLNNNLYIDAEFFGNISRYFNHSCEPNCETRKIMVDGHTRIGFFSKHFIEKGTELTFDYHMEIVGNKPMKCLCGSNSCLQFIQPKKK
ncbi:unnamed protein product [Diamesa hyperborea]